MSFEYDLIENMPTYINMSQYQNEKMNRDDFSKTMIEFSKVELAATICCDTIQSIEEALNIVDLAKKEDLIAINALEEAKKKFKDSQANITTTTEAIEDVLVDTSKAWTCMVSQYTNTHSHASLCMYNKEKIGQTLEFHDSDDESHSIHDIWSDIIALHQKKKDTALACKVLKIANCALLKSEKDATKSHYRLMRAEIKMFALKDKYKDSILTFNKANEVFKITLMLGMKT